MIEIRIHHAYDFTKALVSEEYRENIYLNVDTAEGCHTKNQAEKLRGLLQTISDDTQIRLVTGKDYICSVCDWEKPEALEEACGWEDSVWECRNMLGKVSPNETVTAGYLKKQYFLYQKHKGKPGWKKIISESRKTERF